MCMIGFGVEVNYHIIVVPLQVLDASFDHALILFVADSNRTHDERLLQFDWSNGMLGTLGMDMSLF